MLHEAVHRAIRQAFGMRESYANLPWAVGRRRTRSDLATVIRLRHWTLGAEIGVRRGRFSAELCRACPDLHLICVDPWNAYSNKYTLSRQNAIYAQAVARLTPLGDRVTILRKSSVEALADVADGTLDFVFIDGDHSYDVVAPDIIYWSKKVKAGGIVAVHDYYSWGSGGVVPAVDGYVTSHDIRPWYVTKELEPTAFWVKP